MIDSKSEFRRIWKFIKGGNNEDTIRLYHDDEKIIDSIIENAINENYVDLSNYYLHDEFSIDEDIIQPPNEEDDLISKQCIDEIEKYL